MLDVAIIGAGAAGIAAARVLVRAGLSVLVVEARNRVGGRSHTIVRRGLPIDLGAHWLHAGPINPLVALAREQKRQLRRAPQQGYVRLAGRNGRREEQLDFARAFNKADAALERGAHEQESDRPASTALPWLGPWRESVTRVQGLVCGRPLREASLKDYPSLEYEDNFFIQGGYGAFIAAQARALPLRLACPVTRIDHGGKVVKLETVQGAIEARAAIVTVPVAVLQEGAITFSPALPVFVQEALNAFLPGYYEHVVLHWPDSPFTKPDRLVHHARTRLALPGMLARLEGSPLHYAELDAIWVQKLNHRHVHLPTLIRDCLSDLAGSRQGRSARILNVTDWRGDAFARASWAVIKPGGADARDRLKTPVNGKLFFAGEALSRQQWGTAGGAWAEGEAAAQKLMRHIDAP